MLIEEAQGLSKQDYTAETWTILQKVLDSAISIRDNRTSSQVDYNDKVLSLEAALANLAEKTKPEDYLALSYDDIARYPDDHKGEKVQITGKVLQVSEGDTEIDLRIATDGGWDDVVMVGYPPNLVSGRILEDDMVTVYGTSVGLYSYTAVSGATITVSAIVADEIIIN